MSPVHGFVRRFEQTEERLARTARRQQAQWQYHVHRGRVWFDERALRAHRRLRQGFLAYIWKGSLRSLATAPIIYSLLLPFALLDVCVSIYQWACFPIYGIEKVRRRAYFVMDRHTLGYLNGIEKVNCTYCSYANGLIAYVREVASRTEVYWCPITHARRMPPTHARYHDFVDYGDAAAYRQRLTAMRQTLRDERPYGRRSLRTPASRPREA
jgi:hypothetical protein